MSLANFTFDVLRGVSEVAISPASRQFVNSVPKGDGHPVIICPGFMTDDDSTKRLRRFLADKGYETHGWHLGRNTGFGTTGYNTEYLAVHIDNIVRNAGRKASLVGWSLGGVMAREYARAKPNNVRQVMTLGSPVRGAPKGTLVYGLYKRFSDHAIDSDNAARILNQIALPPKGIPCTSIFSKTDGVVPWRYSIELEDAYTDNIEVYGSHVGLGVNPAVYLAVSDRLALPEDQWEPFDRYANPWRPAIFPSSGHNYLV